VSLNQDLRPDHPSECKLPGQVVLVFQGGGALGSYQAGVYQALYEADIEPDWIIGTSIGAINASLIAGNRRDDRIPKLREFWKQVESHPRWDFSGVSTGFSDALANWSTLVAGIPAPNFLAHWGMHLRRSLQTMLSGFQIGEFRDNDETVKVMLREPSDTRHLLSALDNVYVKTAAGASVPLRHMATFNVILEPGIQWRRDRLPSITVRGVVPDGVQSPDVAKAVFAKLKSLRDGLSADYRIELQGAVEESAKSQTSINEKMPAMLLVVLLLLMVQLQHFGKTLIVLATGPLGMIGAATALLVLQAPFGFVAILGVIALAGIIMRISVILVDQIQQDLAAGHDAFAAIVESAVSGPSRSLLPRPCWP
jgi:AcrB/AcrD/AcrF family/Patatin-like phospholipase